MFPIFDVDPKNTPEGSRTPNLLIRSQMLYPIELRVLLKHMLWCGRRKTYSPADVKPTLHFFY